MTLKGGIKALAFGVACWPLLMFEASAQECRNYLRAARADFGQQVGALQRLEQEASDRLKGLDSRPFDFLLGEARKAAAIVTDPALQPKGGITDCRDPAQPVRIICGDAARDWVEALRAHTATPRPNYDRARFAAAVEDCEKLMGLKPLKSAIRGTD